MTKKTIIQVQGTAIYPRLHEPDTKFNADGLLHTKLRISAEAQARIVAACDPLRDALMAAEKDNPANSSKKLQLADYAIEPEYDEDENETGCFIISPRMKASGEDKRTGKRWSRKVPIFDSASPPKPTNVRIGGGSELRLAIELFPYAMTAQEKVRGKVVKNIGVSLKLAAVQIIELREAGGGGAAEDYGFGGGDGSFVASDDEGPANSEGAGDAGDTSGSQEYDFT